ncbi:DUF4231 domain-containing protein [Streptomyces clavuligerus]|uniref:DUF4231 domain-containing protein n=1 Tax=Streptomyces clavuligerus TaxID=1901 RepID=UPI00020D9395|nr:DUF4231 domain-containing protein [Streptomyces clavuligerus]ANW17466.1 hypothetical protein BB341_04110 [Streptomyces clavuligerus]AXU12013.1 DUF4231 domain-containing protein [Streptomyces clavuligerus]MBY6301866.1 DUF4231 domain-containing protein [Streptomyces clavuligerus]QCS04794.1 DUF4231 domain-containing protein [Streptomyces clavuligerus]QPJ95831.1 DUF4231 domain-containing protein [Streptomyces clavuligerus]
MTVTPRNAAIAKVWDQQSIWSQSADRLKSSVEGARTAALALALVAAALGTAASQSMDLTSWLGPLLAFAAAAAAGAAPFVAQRGGPARLSDWIRARAVSEALKAEVYICLAGAGPYQDREHAPTLLAERAHGFRTDATDLIRHTAGRTPRNRPLPPVTDTDSYVEHRLRRQIDTYYRPKADVMHARVERVSRVELVFGLLGAALAAAAGALAADRLAAWVAVVASLSIGVTAHGIAQRYAYQHLEFLRTAEQLERLLAEWAADGAATGAPTAEAATALVTECEHAISIQNEAWMIRWTVS